MEKAYHLLSDTVHSVWVSAVKQTLVIWLSMLIFAFKGLCLPTKTKLANFIVSFRFHSLLALQRYIVYQGFFQSSAHRKIFPEGTSEGLQYS